MPIHKNGQQTFIINDITTSIPPTNIVVRKEDLTYDWRTLRTSVSTKIASGQGQIMVSVVIPFLNEQVLQLHRLLVEIKQSPYCFVENRFLRESIAPSWHKLQLMAFTVTNAVVAPVPQTSNAWSLTLEMIWFNYFPYIPNFLFKEEWETRWVNGTVEEETGSDDVMSHRYTIGWNYVPSTGARIPRAVIVDSIDTDPEVPAWSTIVNSYIDKPNRSIMDMLQQHDGQVFDLAPLPGNMEPSKFVGQPSDSRVYVRYINFLQRDALMDNFGFNPEEDLIDYGKSVNQHPYWVDQFFRLGETETGSKIPYVHSLASDRVPSKVRSAWISQILKHQHNIEFGYTLFRELRLPDAWNKKIIDYKMNLTQYLMGYGDAEAINKLIVYWAGQQIWSEVYRKGYKNPKNSNGDGGKHIPIGESIEDFLKKAKGHVPKVLTDAERAYRQLLTPDKEGRSSAPLRPVEYDRYNPPLRVSKGIHYGHDIPITEGEDVYAVADGTVIFSSDLYNGPEKNWRWLDVNTADSGPVNFAGGAISVELLDSLAAQGFLVSDGETGTKISSTAFPFVVESGFIIRSSINPDIYFYKDVSTAGYNVSIRHNEKSGVTSISNYLHLLKILVNTGDEVTRGQVVGRAGGTGQFDPTYLKLKINQELSKNPSSIWFNLGSAPVVEIEEETKDELDPYIIGQHLHFEYWEAVTTEPESTFAAKGTEENTDKDTRETKYGAAQPDPYLGRSHVIVDVYPSYEISQDKKGKIIDILETEPGLKQELIERANTALINGWLKDADVHKLQALYASLCDNGWRPYDDLTNVVNVWSKHLTLDVSFRRLNTEYSAQQDQHRNDPCVATAVQGTLRHIVASLPILSHEFPTHQHLGSIEPVYTIQFALNDDNLTNKEGLPAAGLEIEKMRVTCQSNAREFRVIPDGYACVLNTFITRLLGSYKELDMVSGNDTNNNKEIFKKRMNISRSETHTVQGQPGLSMMTMELQETNPYDRQLLISTASKTADIQAAYSEILNALLKFNFDGVNSKYLPLLIAQAANVRLDLRDTKIPLSYGAGWQNLSVAATGPNDSNASRIGYNDSPVKIYEFKNDPNNYEVRIYDPTGELTALVRDLNILSPEQISGTNTYVTSLASGAQSVNSLNIHSSVLAKIYTEALGRDISAQELIKDGYLDLTELLNLYPDELRVNASALYEYRKALLSILTTAEILLAEVEKGGYHNEYLSGRLYDLPIVANQWLAFQKAYELLIMNTTTFGADISKIFNDGADNTLVISFSYRDAFNSDPNVLSTIDNYFTKPHTALSVNALKFIESGVGSFLAHYSGWSLGSDLPRKAVERASNVVGSAISDQIEGADYYRQQNNHIRDAFIYAYLSYMPISVFLIEVAESYLDFLKPLVSDDWTGYEESNLEQRFRLREFYRRFLDQNNMLVPGTVFAWVEAPAILKPGRDIVQLDDGSYGFQEIITETAPGSVAGRFISNIPITGDILYSQTSQELAAQVPQGKFRDFFSSIFSQVELGGPIGGALVFQTENAAEDAKIRYLKSLFEKLARRILQDSGILNVLGLQHLAGLNLQNDYTGQEAYPDLKLPFHPYYQNSYYVAPDFYMWNLYEDGGLNSNEYRRQIAEQANVIIERCHKTLTKQPYIAQISPKNMPFLEESDRATIQDFVIRYSAEGTNVSPTGPMGSPFAMTDEAKIDEDAFFTKWDFANDYDKLVKTSQILPTIDPSYTGQPGSSDGAKYHYRLSASDGNALYPARSTMNTYTELANLLQKKIERNESMFGSRAGYLGKYLKYEDRLIPFTDGVANLDEQKGLSVSQPFAHAFDPDSLKELAIESSADIVSQKASLRRAFPTFKLYFVEEDEFESRFFNFDDFYSFNGVKDFSLTMDKALAADTAVITLQNISGTLDGTARNIITDGDYFDRNKTKQLGYDDKQDSLIAQSGLNTDTTSDQPFGAVVLRPGLNVQLRVGFSNDPSALEVLISGRIVDVVWNKAGDLAEITVQSFGAELENIIKGSYEVQGQTFYGTHQILGAMMLEPELYHFGRWEFGERFQYGEEQDSTLDFIEYSRETFSGRLGVTNFIARQIWKHPAFYLAANVALGVGTLLPTNIFGGLAAKVGGRIPAIVASFSRVLSPVAKDAVVVEGFALNTRVIATALEGAGKSLVDTAAAVAEKSKAIDDVLNLVRGRIGSGAGSQVPGAFIDDLLKAGQASRNPNLAAEVQNIAVRYSDEAQGLLIDLQAKVTAGTLTEAEFAKFVADIAAVERNIALRTFAGRAVGQTAFPAVADIGWWTMSGKITGINLIKYGIGGTVVRNAGLLTTALATDVVANLLRYLYGLTFKSLSKYYTRVKSTLFLSPQDDNLYPPSPKDYMRLENKGWFDRLAVSGVDLAGHWLFGTDQAPTYYNAFFHPNEIFDKKLSPGECKYTPQATSIWRIFYEMTLRHPGWIFGARPYGRDFRYTMFFGVPSQRYWSKPASNQFVDRINRLRHFLSDKKVSRQEYTLLYGDNFDGKTYQEFLDARTQDLVNNEADYLEGVGVDPDSVNEEMKAKASNYVAMYMTSKVAEEYLKGLELRFVPFRRYHMITSNRDLIWNGISGSERSVVNAIDVGYYNFDEDPRNTVPRATVLVKANSYIPENMLKTRPISYPNCTSYTMALRYGMGELIHSMKDMYRGSLIVLGNPRIKPWDIAILTDTQNDIVGPIEVQQVVHNFSFETGFITEIRPGAIVIGNEVASWPLIEAMKLWSLAMQDAEANITELPGNPGLLSSLASHIKTYGTPEMDKYLGEKSKALGLNNLDVDDVYKGLTERKITPPTMGYYEGDITYNFLKGIDGTLGLDPQPNLAQPGIVDTTIRNATDLITIPLAITAEIGFSDSAVFRTYYNSPSLAWLLGGAIIFAKCLREEAVIVVPLMKAGKPIIAGLTYSDPSQIWSNFMGDIKLWIEDAVGGSRDLIEEWDQFGHALWRQVKATNYLSSDKLKDVESADIPTNNRAHTGDL